jgi:hypothetical protein
MRGWHELGAGMSPALGLSLLDIDPNIVKPGWIPLIITIALAAVMVLLYLSMRRQFRKINLPDDSQTGDAPSAPTATPRSRD